MERQQFTAEQKKEIVGKVDKLKKEGQTTLEACGNAKVSEGNYYAWKRNGVKGRKKVAKSVSKARKIELPLSIPTLVGSKVFVFYGTTAEIASLVRSL